MTRDQYCWRRTATRDHCWRRIARMKRYSPHLYSMASWMWLYLWLHWSLCLYWVLCWLR